MKVTRLFSLFIWPQDDQCFGMTPGSEAKSFNFCVSLGCIIPGHASEKSHGCLGYRTEYALSCLIGRFTAQYGNPYEQTRTMESHKFSCWLIWRKQRCFLSSQTLYWPGNISSHPAHGQKCEDDAGRALRKSVGHVRFEASDMKESFCQDSFKVFVFFTPFWVRFPIWLFSNGLKPTRNLSTWKKTLGCSRPRDCGCSNGALGRDTCMKLFVCSEAANAELQQRLEEARGLLQYSWNPS